MPDPDLTQTILILTPVLVFWVTMSGPLRWFPSTPTRPLDWYDEIVDDIPWDGAFEPTGRIING